MDDPLRDLEHTHAELTRLVAAAAALLRDDDGHPRAITTESRPEVLRLLEQLGEQALHHFADEEEGLFPFVRDAVPTKADVVERLGAAHDSICTGLVRLVHLARHGADWQLTILFEVFEHAYAEHSREEARLFEDIDRQLGAAGRAELASLLRGLS